MRRLRLDGPLVAELQAALPTLPVDREELRGSLGRHPEREQIPSERRETRDIQSPRGSCTCGFSQRAQRAQRTTSILGARISPPDR